MKKLFLIAAACLMIIQVKAMAIPSQITYQGTLKQNGVPVGSPSGTSKAMTFQLLSSDGQTPYSTIITQNVQVINGLFSVPLNFQLLAPYTWDTIDPYIQVSVEGQALTPIEHVSATVYAFVSSTVVNGSITPAKMNTTAFQAAGVGLVPQGAIMMFDTDCPAGWTRDIALDSRFPLGSASYGTLGGVDTHSASISTAVSEGGPIGVGTPTGATNGEYLEDIANQYFERASKHTHTISFDGAGSSFTQLPPYISVIYCKKN